MPVSVVVDEVLRNEVEKGNWYKTPQGYIYGGSPVGYLHHLVWALSGGEPVPDGCQIDHINRDRTDNRLHNLRIVTRRGQNLNRRDSSSRVRKINRKWWVKLDFYGPGKWIKGYDDEDTALLVAKHRLEMLIEREVIAYAPQH